MNSTRLIVGRFMRLLVAIGLFWCGLLVAAERPTKKSSRSTNATDQAACQHQLNRIYGAIQQYQKKHGELPRWLGDLVSEFIDDATLLECPYVRETGHSREWRQRFMMLPVFGDPDSTYAYELCLEPAYRGSTNTCRDYKQRQMDVMGFSVPMVRCLAHRPVLNLANDGNIYQSPDEWEDIFVSRKEDVPYFHNIEWMATQSRDEVIQNMIRPRPAGLAPRLLDLSNYYNALLFHLSQMSADGRVLATYPEGTRKIGGVDFDIRGLIHLKGKDFPMSFPGKVEGIKVGRNGAKIHFLHGTMFSAPDGARIATWIVHFTDGRKSEIPIAYGQDVKTRWFDARQTAGTGTAEMAWVSPADQTGTAGQSLRLYLKSWKNPYPSVSIARIDLVSEVSASAPFVVAITIE